MGGTPPAGRTAFQRSLVSQFDGNYAQLREPLAFAPSDPTPARLFSGSTTYTRPGTAYLALRQILGHGRFDRALQRIQRDYGGRSITEPQLEAEFARFLPAGPATPADGGSGHFFTPVVRHGVTRRRRRQPAPITGPGLAGPGFYGGACR